MLEQLELDLFPAPTLLTCDHYPGGFYTHACVPGGFFCNTCKSLVWQTWIPPDQPKRIGYVSAPWAWKYEQGRDWTTMEKVERQDA